MKKSIFMVKMSQYLKAFCHPSYYEVWLDKRVDDNYIACY